MTMDRDDADLDALFAEARKPIVPPDALVARVLADADATQAKARVRDAAAPAVTFRKGFLAGLIDALGGWPTVSGVTLAGVTGLAVGFAAPDLVDSWSGGQITNISGQTDTLPDMSALWDGTWEEGGDV